MSIWNSKHIHWWGLWFPSRYIEGALVRCCMADYCEAKEYSSGPKCVQESRERRLT